MENERSEMTNKGANHMKKMKQLLKNQKGLTLIELLAVIVILAIVAAIAVPSIGSIISKQEQKAVLADASMILSAAKLAAANGECGVAPSYTCTEAVLLTYIESKDITAASDIAASQASGVWSITYPILSTTTWTITPTPTVATGGIITETELLTAMGQ